MDALKHVVGDFNLHYVVCSNPTTTTTTNNTLINITTNATNAITTQCEREVSLLYLILMLGTVWLGLTVYNFTKTPYLSHQKRELLSDYALPVAVVVFR